MPSGYGEGPDRRAMMEKMKWELARELGVTPPVDGYWGKFSARDCGKIGALLRQRLRVIESALWGENDGATVKTSRKMAGGSGIHRHTKKGRRQSDKNKAGG
jgi:small acid-soluble spore protein A (major alpha-type SASP)